MALILLEALGAGIVLVLIVWWTMFSGRKGGEMSDTHEADDAAEPRKAPKPANAEKEPPRG